MLDFRLMTNIDYREFDRQIWEEELEDFVPSLVYDMHTHMWSGSTKGRVRPLACAGE